MATFTVGIPNPANQSEAGGGLAATISFTGWTRSDFAGGATLTDYQTDPVTGLLRAVRQLTLTINGQNQVTACNYDIFTGTVRVPQFQATGFATALDSFLSSSINLSMAIGGDGTYVGNNFDNEFRPFYDGNTFYGYGGNDTMVGGTIGNHQDIFYGGSGSDTMISLGGNGGRSSGIFMFDTDPTGTAVDYARGGGGIAYSTANFSLLENGINVNLATGAGVDGSGNRYTLERIQNAVGSQYADVIRAADVFTYMYGSTISGLGGNDTITGGLRNDILNGDGGNDVISGGDSNDELYGGAGNDILTGGAGADKLDGGAGIDTADYSASGAALYLIMSSGSVSGGDADGDTLTSIENINGSQLGDYIVGTSGDNILRGNDGSDALHGLGGNNQLFGGAGSDLLTSSGGSDLLDGGTGTDSLYGGVGNDTLYGGAGVDTLNGEDGNDILRGDAGADVINGGLGIDRADYSTSTVGVTVNLTTGTASDGDTLTGIENLLGSKLNDVLLGSSGANVLYGNYGNDQLFGLLGNDNLSGQAGDDALFCGEGNDTASGGDGNDGLFGEEGADRLYGGAGNDYLQGGDGNDVIWGDAGDDQIEAGAGNDLVVLGAGNDEFTLGLGDDRVRFDYGNGADVIRDFGLGNDVIDFTNTDMWLGVLQANTVQTAAGVLMNLGSGSILLEGLTLSQIDWAADFVFAV